MTIIFETPRLIIREFELSDFETTHEYASQAEVVQFQKWSPNDEEATRQFLEDSLADQKTVPRLSNGFCICLKENQIHIGGCRVYVKDPGFNKAHIGYIINPKYWGQGFASEATQGLLNFAKQYLKIKHIFATCDQRNIASKRVLEKTGFLLEKIIKDDFEQKGTMRTTLLFQLP